MKLEGKAAIVIGGAKGIGKAYARALLEKKCKVYVCDILEDVGKETEEEFTKEFGQGCTQFSKVDGRNQQQAIADVSEAFKAARALFGRLDVALNNVGVCDENDWQRALDLNLGTTIRITLAALEVMGKDKGGEGGALVHTASNAGIVPAFYGPLYSATKAAMIMYARAYSTPLNYEQHGIRMMCICPTFVQTDFLMENADHPERVLHMEVLVEKITSNPQGQLLKPEWVSKVMTDMVEDDSINGVAAQMLEETPIYHYKE